MTSNSASPSEGTVASVLVSFSKVGVTYDSISPSQGVMSSVLLSPCKEGVVSASYTIGRRHVSPHSS